MAERSRLCVNYVIPRLQGGTPVQHVHPFGLPMPVLVLEFGTVPVHDVVHKDFCIILKKVDSGQRHPVLFYLTQPPLDGGAAHSEGCCQLRYGLLAILIASPLSIVFWSGTVSELVSTFLAKIGLDSPAFSVFYSVRTTAHWTFRLIHFLPF